MRPQAVSLTSEGRMRPILTLLLFICSSAVTSCMAQTGDVKSQTRALLDAYARQDAKAVLASISDDTVMYGSDESEVFRGPAAIQKMLSDDARLWAGTAHIGEMQDVTIVKAHGFQSIFFEAPFTVGGRPAVPVRFCMVWRQARKRWLLVQSSNAVVTQHQGAADLLGKH